MKRLHVLSLAAVAGMFAAGCQTAGGPAASPALQKQKALEARLSAHLAAQSTISNQAERLHADLLASAQEMRSIKEQANLISSAAQTNRLALEALRVEMEQQRKQIEDAVKKAREESERVKALQDALSREQNVRQQEAVALKAAADRQAAEERKKADELRAALAREAKLRDQAVAEAGGAARATAEKQTAAEHARAQELQAALTKEQQLRAQQQTLAQQREQEIAELRKALADREQLLRAQTAKPAAAEAPAAVPAVKQVAAGNAALRKGQVDEAEKQFKEALIAMPGMVGARIGMAACRYEKGDFAEAERIVLAVLKEDRRNAQALGLRGLLHWRRGQLEEAEDVLTLAVKEQKEDSQLRNYLGIVLYERKKFAPATAALRKAVEIDPANGEAFYNLSVVLAMSPDPDLDDARAQYARALELGSSRDEAMEKILAPAATQPAKP